MSRRFSHITAFDSNCQLCRHSFLILPFATQLPVDARAPWDIGTLSHKRCSASTKQSPCRRPSALRTIERKHQGQQLLFIYFGLYFCLSHSMFRRCVCFSFSCMLVFVSTAMMIRLFLVRLGKEVFVVINTAHTTRDCYVLPLPSKICLELFPSNSLQLSVSDAYKSSTQPNENNGSICATTHCQSRSKHHEQQKLNRQRRHTIVSGS